MNGFILRRCVVFAEVRVSITVIMGAFQSDECGSAKKAQNLHISRAFAVILYNVK